MWEWHLASRLEIEQIVSKTDGIQGCWSWSLKAWHLLYWTRRRPPEACAVPRRLFSTLLVYSTQACWVRWVRPCQASDRRCSKSENWGRTGSPKRTKRASHLQPAAGHGLLWGARSAHYRRQVLSPQKPPSSCPAFPGPSFGWAAANRRSPRLPPWNTSVAMES